MIEFIQTNPDFLQWMALVSLLMFIGTLAIVPWLVTRIPEDYFHYERRKMGSFSGHHPLVRLILLSLKNLVGYLLIPLGMLMLVLPGQGILTMVIGLVLIDFPGKFHLERWLACQPGVARAMNWLREKAGRKPLRF
jgi:hypothetical protein